MKTYLNKFHVLHVVNKCKKSVTATQPHNFNAFNHLHELVNDLVGIVSMNINVNLILESTRYAVQLNTLVWQYYTMT